MAKTTFEEEIYLRALTGRLVGKALADLGLNKVTVVASRNIICSSIATATEATFITLSGGVTCHFLAEKDVPGAFVVHVRIFAAGGLAEALKDEKIREYLSKKDLFVYTVGFDEDKSTSTRYSSTARGSSSRSSPSTRSPLNTPTCSTAR
ncbi:hypothetical protein [Thermococcus sp.]|uniref:hypothetical protein n=1 Tax=Thermococcus sp. TaxID=35749 RepID=UPI0026323384|nr:hypothetical protein [Thermococcus sp.]